MPACMHVYVHVCACMCDMYTHMHTCMHAYMHTYIHTYIYTYISRMYTCIQMYIHACTHTCYGFRGTKPDTKHNTSSCESARVLTHACICVFIAADVARHGSTEECWICGVQQCRKCNSGASRYLNPHTPARMHVHSADPIPRLPPPPHINTNCRCHHSHACTHRCSTSRSTTSRVATSPFRRRRPKAIVSTNALVAVMAAVRVCLLCTHMCAWFGSPSATHIHSVSPLRVSALSHAHAHIQVMAVGMVADTTAAVVATAGTCIGCLCHSSCSVRL